MSKLMRTKAMLRPSGEICGSLTHCRSKMSSGLKKGSEVCACPSAGSMHTHNAAKPIRRSCMLISFACHPAVALMCIDDATRLHESVANGGSDEAETSSLEILAHRIAVCGRLGDAAQGQRPPANHPAAGELPEVVVEGAWRSADLEVRPRIGNECFD